MDMESRLSALTPSSPCVSSLPPSMLSSASFLPIASSTLRPSRNVRVCNTRHRSQFLRCSKPGDCVSRIRVMAEVKEAAGTGLKVGHVVPFKTAAVVAPSALPDVIAGHSEIFQNVTSEEDLISGIKREVEAKRIPSQAGYGMEELYYNYRDAVLGSGMSYDQQKVVQIMATVLDRILLQFEEPFTFPSFHKAIREPYDYYLFGQNYICPLIDFRNSYLGNAHHFEKLEQQLKQGHNVVLFSNHQTEADPAVMALLLESNHPYLAESLTYIAGDRVVLDPFCKPFSMGRNLLCVYSKKHINDVPELADMKRKANTRTLKELVLLLRKGGQLIWIAPSGGRDRPDPVTGQWFPAAFDIATVDSMKRLTEQARVPGHMYPLAILCYDIMPPPREVRKEIGERRSLGFSSVGMSIAGELNFKEITATATASNPAEANKSFSQVVWQQVNENYTTLMHAVYGGRGLAASTSSVVLSQPWMKSPSIQRNGHRSSLSTLSN